MAKQEVIEKLDQITEGIGTDGLLQLIRDFANWLESDDLQEFLEKNGYIEPDDEQDDEQDDEPLQ